MLDRIAPWNLASVKSDKQLVVARYSVPIVHCLIPNTRRPLISSRTFRRALTYALRRDVILASSPASSRSKAAGW